MSVVTFEPIGIVHTPFDEPAGTPVQPTAARGVEGTVEILPPFVDGLADLDGFSHVILLFHCHLAGEPRLRVTPFLDDTPRGVFATRAPSRPNAIGLSVVRLREVREGVLLVLDVDMLDGTPLLDIKPYVPDLDCREADRLGWLEDRVNRFETYTDDGRFADR